MHAWKSALLVTAAALIGAASLAAPPPPPLPPETASQVRMPPPGRRSPHEAISASIGDRGARTPILIVYGRPYTKDPRNGEERKIWGGLVPFGKVWRTGANEATLLITQQPLLFSDVKVPAGACSLFTLPAEDGSAKLIFNRQVGQWGLQYDEKQDIGRVDLRKESLETAVDQFTIALENNPAGGGILKLTWERTQYSAAFGVSQ